ncbi:carboxymuconolactone decarboxylase family protein [Streptomyces calidiresistens]|uniref:Carboxymuconolactone decarboxylase family protein n=1 Tax=Streptomyces calidiresistens TaxID=1485586 RepID=A0A7W3T3P2_9ACTN|nr:carboxymuconolactone decarboxylase family protein [Streptomyces calidiresistens]MBB0230365.1 carboxymuconolactone decarboxylase family protein [Streptomyces calidiresistens]
MTETAGTRTGGDAGGYIPGDGERHKRGMDRMRQVLGPKADTVLGDLADVAPELGRFIVEFAYGEVHSSPGLDHRQRSLVAISVLSGIGGCEPALELHVHGALNVGLDPSEIVETVMQCAVYAGFPRALCAMAVVRQVFEERGVLPRE